MTYVHVGRNAPARLLKQGWTETSALPLGRGIFRFRLSPPVFPKPEKSPPAPKPVKAPSPF